MSHLGLGFLLLLLGLTRIAAAPAPTSIASPRPQGWIVDQAGVLSPATIADLNRLLDEVHRHEGAELAIVTVPTIDGANPRQFATALFNHWRIGDPVRNNGLLLFVALRDRKAEIILGRGLESAAHLARSDRIMQEVIVPHFRSGDSAGGLAAGARACAEQFYSVTTASPAEVVAAQTPVEAPVPAHQPATRTRVGPERSAATIPLVATTSRSPSAPVVPFALPALLGLGLAGSGALAWLLVRGAGGGRHTCPDCRTPMTKLDDVQDDAHLSPVERAEERVGSVDYEVWLCPSCLRADKVRHGRWFTRYSVCPRCGAKTRSSAQRTLSPATTVATGLIEIHEVCACCNDTQVTTRVLPMIVESSTSSSSSSGFSGGSSSGGGSSGSW